MFSRLTQIPKGFVEKVESEIEHLRPAYRKIHDEDFKTIDPATCSALVLPDLCFVGDSAMSAHPQQYYTPTISVEIKVTQGHVKHTQNAHLLNRPKKGFMPAPGSLFKEDSIKGKVCKFCMHKKLKEKEGRWNNSSNYCPLDLFSGGSVRAANYCPLDLFLGDRRRMMHALLSLYGIPQNNFKVFQDGREVFSDTVQEDLTGILHQFFGDSVNGFTNGLQKQHELHTFLDLIVDALLSTPEGAKPSQICHTQSNQATPNSCAHSNGGSEGKGHASSEVKVMNRTKLCSNFCAKSSYPNIDNSQNDGAASVMLSAPESVLGRILCTQQLDDAVDIDGVFPLYQRVKDHLKAHPEDRCKFGVYGPFTKELWLDPCIQGFDTADTDSLEYAVYKVKRFIVSKTMQDCSIMVAMQRCPSCSQSKTADVPPCLTDGHGRKFHYSVSIIDLDPKPFDKLTKYNQLEKNILQAYTEYL
ncbi:Inositol-pentakisphosphate 2-kinase [Mizuhopecten yessoensis]|uniref:Inositol-pentakisphosphate 2-kinase n=1 Tax=Mizuhopecten yessoensis TaxID=6573 RepID=A0A210PF81_MIZYE|nr:Inositol-pentakisphosphate 2-kinase [Mizuhopecten yessoensis]